MRFLQVFTIGLFLLAYFTPPGDCAPIRQDETSASQESLSSSGATTVEPSPTALQSLPSRLFRGIPFPIIFDGGSGTPQMILPARNLEDLEKILFREDRKTNPAYSLKIIEANGQVEGKIARIRFDLTLSTSSDPIVTVPIGLKEGHCLPPLSEGESEPYHRFEYKGEGSCELTVDPQTGDFLLLIRNPPQVNPDKEGLHQVSFTLSFPVENIGLEEQRMKISAPQAVTSRLVLSVSIPDAFASDAQGVAILSPSKPLDNGGTQFEIRGFPKLLDLSWRRQVQNSPPEKQVDIQVENASILVRMTPRETEFDATLPVRAVGGSLQHFRVRLPPHSRYRAEPTESPDYQIHEIPLSDSPSDSEGEATVSPLLEVRVTGQPKQDAVLPVRIRADRSFSVQEQSSWCGLGGFEVEEAQRQYGQLEIHVSDDLKLNLRNQHGIREDEISMLDSQTQARFVYSTQPFSIEARVMHPQTRISVKAEYQVLLERGQILLSGKIQTTISGSKTNHLQWNFYDWQLEEFGPMALVDFSGVVQEEGEENQKNGTRTIPLRLHSDGPMTLTFKASRPMPTITDNRTTIDFPFPIPIADRIEPATIAIVLADNLELLSENQKIVGMSPGNRNTSLSISSPPRQQPMLIFRSDIPVDSVIPTMSFRSDLMIHKQEVQALSKTVVRLLDPKDQINQTIQYNVKFEPMYQITLLIPRWVHDNGSLRIFYDDKIISETGQFTFPDVVAGSTLVRRRITLPTPLIGNGTLLLRYSMSPTEIQPEMTMRISVPQILPADTEIIEQTIVASVPGGVNVLLADGNATSGLGRVIPSNISLDSDEKSPNRTVEPDNPWKKLEKNGNDPEFRETMFSTASWEKSLALSVQLDYRDILGTTVVERAWIQTWLTDRIRVDRASFRIRSDHDKISLFLPTGFDRNHFSVTWDNTTVPFQYEDGEIVLVQPKELRSQSHLLVVKYQLPNMTFSSSSRVKIDLPYFSNDVWVRRTYWQVILLEQNRHLFGDLPGWTPEFHWNWTGMYWKRDSSLSQDELELWIGSSEKQEPSDSPETTRYLFSSFNPQRQCELRIMNRAQLILFSSGAILLVGFALIYFPRLRQLGVMFALTVLLISIFLYQPTPALLVFQASILGVALSLVSAVLARIFYRESDWKYVQPFLSPNMAPPIETPVSSALSSPMEIMTDGTQHRSSVHDEPTQTQP